MFSSLGVPELLIIAGVIILLFGAKKLPEMARSLGKSAKAFKEETKDLRKGDSDEESAAKATQAQAQLPQAQPQVQASPVVPPVEQDQPHKNAS